MNIKRAKLLQLNDDAGRHYYGGDQGWYISNTHAMGGCGSVSGANVLRALAQTNSDFMNSVMSSKKMPEHIKQAICSESVSRDMYNLLMIGIYRKMGAFELFPLNRLYDKKERGSKPLFKIPPNMGQTNTGFIIGIIRFARKMGINISVKCLNTAFLDSEKGRKFIDKGLTNSGAVVLLTSYNKHSLKVYPADCDLDRPLTSQRGSYDSSMKCHFATITDMDLDRLLISTWGKPAVASFPEVSTSWKSIKAFESTLMYIYPSDRSESTKCILGAFWPFIKGIIQAIIRHAF